EAARPRRQGGRGRQRAAVRELTGEVRGPRGRKARAGQRGSQSEEPSHDGCAHRIPPRPRASRRGERAAEEQPMSLLWATRGRSCGFRILRSGWSEYPLLPDAVLFAAIDDQPPELFRRLGDRVALPFPAPEQRTDAAGCTIPPEFVLSGSESDGVSS